MSSAITNALLTIRLPVTQAVEARSTSDSSRDIGMLTRGLAAGDDRAFCEFHNRYFDRLYQFLLVVARGREDEAREALQQTLLRVVRYARMFDSEDAFWCWLKVLARSAARDAGRKQHRYLALLQNFARCRSVEAESAQFEDDRLQRILEECLEELEPADRCLVEAKYLDGLTVNEIATDAGLTEKAVESRLLRLRKQLRARTLEKLHTA